LEDEEMMAGTREEKLKVVELYNRALADFYSVELWEKYLQFVIDEFNNGEFDVKIVYEILQQAMVENEYNFEQGFKVWEIIVNFQMEQQNSPDQLRQMFHKRLSIPHKSSVLLNRY
jgi:hypothetical protein